MPPVPIWNNGRTKPKTCSRPIGPATEPRWLVFAPTCPPCPTPPIPKYSRASFSLLDAQLVVAREHGFANWSTMKQHIESLPPAADVAVPIPQREEDRGWIDRKWIGIENGEEGAPAKPKADFSPLEQAFIEAAMVSRWNPKPKSYVPQLAALPPSKSRASSIRSVPSPWPWLCPTTGSEPTVRFLLDQGVPRLDLKTDAYNPLHEAVYNGLIENLRGVFAAGLADATGIALKAPSRRLAGPCLVTLLVVLSSRPRHDPIAAGPWRRHAPGVAL